jgi:hypothetical protein
MSFRIFSSAISRSLLAGNKATGHDTKSRNQAQLHPQRGGHGLDSAQQAEFRGDGGIPNDRHSRHPGRDLLEQLRPFPAETVFEQAESAGEVAARARQAFDVSGADRIDHSHKYDRHGAGRLLQRARGCARRGQDDVGALLFRNTRAS